MENDRVRRLIEFADERVPIAMVCGITGMHEDVSSSRKVHCPFGDIAHEDGGAKATMRVYWAANHAYCFEEKWFATPVRMAAREWGMPYAETARRLLDEAGISPPSWRQRWEDLHHPLPVDQDSLAQALQTWCGRWPGWEHRQFEAAEAAALAACFGTLGLVRDAAGASEWLGVCKQVMLSVLEGDGNGGYPGAGGMDHDHSGRGDARNVPAGGAPDGAPW